MNYISIDFIIKEHSKLINLTGGSSGIRDIGMLESAFNTPFMTYDNKDLYASNIEKIAKITYSIIKNHPFIDGNKRTGMHIMLILLSINHYPLWFSVNNIVVCGTGLASGIISYDTLVEILNNKCIIILKD